MSYREHPDVMLGRAPASRSPTASSSIKQPNYLPGAACGDPGRVGVQKSFAHNPSPSRTETAILPQILRGRLQLTGLRRFPGRVANLGKITGIGWKPAPSPTFPVPRANAGCVCRHARTRGMLAAGVDYPPIQNTALHTTRRPGGTQQINYPLSERNW